MSLCGVPAAGGGLSPASYSPASPLSGALPSSWEEAEDWGGAGDGQVVGPPLPLLCWGKRGHDVLLDNARDQRKVGVHSGSVDQHDNGMHTRDNSGDRRGNART